MKIKSALLIVIAGATSAPASAHWHYSRWGMSADEVVAASAGAARLSQVVSSAGDQDLGSVAATGDHQIGSVRLPVNFRFRDGKLHMVEIKAEGDALCWALGQRLGGEYGRPFAEESNAITQRRTWKDEDRGNRTEFVSMGDVCWLRYSPLSSPRQSEL